MSKFIALDFETANNYRNSACAIGIVKVENDKITEKYSYLIKPPFKTFQFTYIHGITWEDVKNKPTFSELWPMIKSHFSDIDFIAAHNAPFDKSVLKACCEHYGIMQPQVEFKCTVQLSRKLLQLPSCTLDKVCEYFGYDLDHHEVLSDTIACAKIMINYQKMLNC